MRKRFCPIRLAWLKSKGFRTYTAAIGLAALGVAGPIWWGMSWETGLSFLLQALAFAGLRARLTDTVGTVGDD